MNNALTFAPSTLVSAHWIAGEPQITMERTNAPWSDPAKTSDIVALMVAEHQTRTQNLITRCSYQTRIALRYQEQLDKELNRPTRYPSESTMSRIKSVAEPLLQALLMSNEFQFLD